MKRILFYTDTPNVGGAEKQMNLLAKYLKSHGYSVSLACGAYSKMREWREELARIYDEVFVLPGLGKHDPRHYFWLKRILKGGQFDLAHLHLWNPGACRWAFWAAASRGVPIVTTEHDPFPLHGIKRWIKNKCLLRTAHTIAISRENLLFLKDFYGIPEEKVSLVHNGIELSRFLSGLARADLPVKPGDTVITCIAELHERKGHRYLLEAFERLRQNMPTLQLMLVGAGPLERELREKWGKNEGVHFLGWREDIPEILRASDIFVLPSLKEAFGLSILEAMASGAVVVATSAGGPAEIIEGGKSGLLVPPGSSGKLAEAIRALILNPEQKRNLEEQAKKRVREFTVDTMAEKTMEVYKTIFSSF